MSYKFIALFAVLCTVEAASSPSTGHIFQAEKNVEYALNKPLEVGDVIRAWGVYRDHSTSKFSVNIKGQGGLYLLHVDFRPWNNVVVLNNYVYGWKAEIRPWFSKYNFSWNKLFEVKIEVHEEHYRIYFNGVELRRRFPHRIDISRANHVALHGGSNGFKWSALKLPNSEAGRVMGVPFSTTTNEKNYLSRPLAVGDKFTAWGIYATGSVKFSVNLMMETELHFMMHVDFRPPPNENKVVLNSKKENGWEREIRTPIPRFENGKVFSVTVVCLEGEFEIYHDNQVLGSRFPYRDGFKLEDVKFVWLLGGSQGMIWTDLAISQPRPEYQVKVMCDDISTIFVDGEQQTVSGTGVWNQIATLNIPTTTQTIGVQCRNTGGPYGLMAQVTEESGEVITVTDESWQCSNMAEDGWSTRKFRGSWNRAVITYQQLDFQREEGAWAGMSRDKRVIWTNSAADTTVYCRRDLSDSGSETEIFTEETVTTTTTETFTEKFIEITEEPTEEKAETTVSEYMTTSSQGTPAYTVPQECNDFTTGTIRNFDFETSGMLRRFEGDFQIITCKMRRTEIDSCNDVLSGLQNETNLLLHHSDNQNQVNDHDVNENNQTTILEGDERYLFKVQFKFEIKYETHHERIIYCGATNSHNSLRVVSNRRRFPRVEKLYKVRISPKEVRVPTNTPFTLTCFFDDPEVKDYVYWQTKNSNDDMPWMTVGNSRIANNSSSVLTIMKSKEWKGTYSCSTRRNLHPNKYRDQVKVEVFEPEFTEPTVTATIQPKEPTSSTEPAGSVSPTESEETTSTTSWRKPTEAPRPSCKEDEFTCRERCISSTWRCDGDKDCIGGEDEENCDKTENEIKPF